MQPLPPARHQSHPSHPSRTSHATGASAEAGPGKAGWMRRFGWLLLIWCASVAALGVAATLLKLVMHAIGMSS